LEGKQIMEKSTWKILAIIFITLFVAESTFMLWAYKLAIAEEEKELQCIYDVCGEYPYGEYYNNICICYDYDLLGQLIEAKTEYMK